MKWMLVALVYTVTSENVSHEVKVHEVPVASEQLCEAARAKMEVELKTRAVTVKATCFQVSE